MRILIDADGCPVTKTAVEIAKEYNIEAVIFCDTSHLFSFDYDKAKIITVGKGADSADLALVNNAQKDDIVVTQDYGLSAMALSKKCIVLTQNGLIISDKNIDSLLFSRHIAKKERRKGAHLKGPSKRTSDLDEKFEKILRRIIDENTHCAG